MNFFNKKIKWKQLSNLITRVRKGKGYNQKGNPSPKVWMKELTCTK